MSKKIIRSILALIAVFLVAIPAHGDTGIAQFSPDLIGVYSNSSSINDDFVDETESELTQYKKALSLMYNGDFRKAADIFSSISGYMLSDDHIKYCLTRLSEDGIKYYDYMAECQGSRHVGAGMWYDMPQYILYIPDEIGSSTRCVMYFPGSNGEMAAADGTPVLFQGHVERYLATYYPHGIMIFMRSSGFSALTPLIDLGYRVLESVARDNGIAVHGLVLAGSSMGGYTAVKGAAYIFETFGVPVNSVLVYDMGMDFEINILPTADEYHDIARSGTDIYFFEQPDVTLNKSQLQDMLGTGIAAHLVWCKRDNHNVITYDGFDEGSISWAIGEIDSLREDYYMFVS